MEGIKIRKISFCGISKTFSQFFIFEVSKSDIDSTYRHGLHARVFSLCLPFISGWTGFCQLGGQCECECLDDGRSLEMVHSKRDCILLIYFSYASTS